MPINVGLLGSIPTSVSSPKMQRRKDGILSPNMCKWFQRIEMGLQTVWSLGVIYMVLVVRSMRDVLGVRTDSIVVYGLNVISALDLFQKRSLCLSLLRIIHSLCLNLWKAALHISFAMGQNIMLKMLTDCQFQVMLGS